jgi:hypothetical protein
MTDLKDKMEDNIELMRRKLEDVWVNMSPEDFERIHAKFFGALLSTEEGFKKLYPTEWKKYEKKFYGE